MRQNIRYDVFFTFMGFTGKDLNMALDTIPSCDSWSMNLDASDAIYMQSLWEPFVPANWQFGVSDVPVQSCLIVATCFCLGAGTLFSFRQYKLLRGSSIAQFLCSIGLDDCWKQLTPQQKTCQTREQVYCEKCTIGTYEITINVSIYFWLSSFYTLLNLLNINHVVALYYAYIEQYQQATFFIDSTFSLTMIIWYMSISFFSVIALIWS